MYKVLSLILGGGKGTRLYPLTKERSKPAVPFGGKYRIVDIPISNCLNSGFEQVYILTQFNSASLHMHIASSYNFDRFSRGFVEILAAEQTFEHSGWYEGTADSVRKNFIHFKTQNPTHYVVLSGDQLYRMDLQKYMKYHIESGADITIASTPVGKSDTKSLGILQINDRNKVIEFVEKPPLSTDLSGWKLQFPRSVNQYGEKKEYLASMGIYIFNAKAMEQALDNSFRDFGKEVIPAAIQKFNVHTYVFDGYWADIGTIKSFYDASMDLTSPKPKFNFYDEQRPIYTHPRNLPPSKILQTTMTNAAASEGCVITNATISHSVIGIRSIIKDNVTLEGVLCMGADYYESDDNLYENREKSIPDIGIGKNVKIRKAIIDKNARIGKDSVIGYSDPAPKDGDYDQFYVADGIIVIKKNAIIPPGTVF